ncbi:hypothetical protein Q427_10005 [Halomonas sp. BC04]|nr:hypothetical protein Q427_10005 [Halomonas sp. BC04]
MMRRGPIAWMVNHGVAPNLLMLLLILGGLAASTMIKKEVFPDFELEIIHVAIGYPGATPGEVERSLLLPMEAALADVDGIDELTATANEGAGRISATLVEGIEVMRVYQEIQQAINAITTLPAAADPARFSLAGRSRSVMSLQLHGWVDERLLHEVAEDIRAELQAASGISRVELSGTRDRETQVLLDEEAMQRYGIEHRQLASRIGDEALDLAGGRLATGQGEWLIRYQGRRDDTRGFADLPILACRTGDSCDWAISPEWWTASPKPIAKYFSMATRVSAWRSTRSATRRRSVSVTPSRHSSSNCGQGFPKGSA